MLQVKFRVLKGPDVGRDFVYEGYQSFVIGRGGEADQSSQVPTDPYMSRLHALVEMGANKVSVRDLGSSNGVHVNGKRVARADLCTGDTLHIGHTSMEAIIANSRDEEEFGERVLESIGASLRDYECLRCISSGTGGEVHLALQRDTGKIAAVKILPLSSNESSKAVAHFMREIEIAASLRHPHIVRTLGASDRGEELWIAFEWIQGLDLQAHVNQHGPMKSSEVTSIARDLLHAIGYAHNQGVIHRDIKPKNVLVEKSDGRYRVKLADFGLAKSLRDAGQPCLTTSDSIKGTPKFMPPEQLRDARKVSVATDIFGAGATLYYAATASWHYEGDGETNWSDLMRAVYVPVQMRNADVPEALANAIDQSLDPDPSRRPPTAMAMYSLIENTSTRR